MWKPHAVPSFCFAMVLPNRGIRGGINFTLLPKLVSTLSRRHSRFLGDEVVAMERNVPNLRKKLILPGVGHWTQQESPDAANQALIEFLRLQ